MDNEEVVESKVVLDDSSMKNEVCESNLPDLASSVDKDSKDEAVGIPTDNFAESDQSVDADKIENRFVESDDDEDLFEKPTVWDDPPKQLPNNSPTKHEIADDRTKDSEVRDIESGDLSDDEFGDFG